MVVPKTIASLSREKRTLFGERFLERYLDPAFGAMTKTEIDLLVFSLLHEVGASEGGKTHYDIARDLRVAPLRVRFLKMRMQLRDVTQTDDLLRARVIDCLSRSRFAKDGSIIQFGVEDPLVREDIAARLKKIGATADSSFNRELVRIQLDAFVDFIESLMPGDQQEKVRQSLIKAGMDDASFKGVVLGALGKLGAKAAGAAGDVVAKQAGELAGPAIKHLLSSGAGMITSVWKGIFVLESTKPSATIAI